MLLTVVGGCVDSNLVQVCQELPIRTIVLILKSGINKIKPRFLRDNLSVIRGDPLLNPLLQVYKVFLILGHVGVELLFEPPVLVIVESMHIRHRLIVVDDVPKTDSHGGLF